MWGATELAGMCTTRYPVVRSASAGISSERMRSGGSTRLESAMLSIFSARPLSGCGERMKVLLTLSSAIP
jgi:hypothetical protein